MGFYGNILTTDLGLLNRFESLSNEVNILRQIIQNTDFVIDGDDPGTESEQMNLAALYEELKERLQIVEADQAQIKTALAQLYTEFTLVHNLLITSQELNEWREASKQEEGST